MPLSRRTWSIWAIGVLFGPLVLLTRTRTAISDNSYLWHITAGRLQLDLGSVLTADPFSFTAAGQRWRTQSWLAELAYAWSEGRWGVDVGRWIPPLVGGLTFLILTVVAAKYLRPGLGLAVVMALTALVALPFMNPRPVVFSYLLMALVVLALERRHLSWTVPLIAWLWAGLHGSFFLVFVMLGLHYIQTNDRSIWKPAVGSLVTVSMTAHGVAIWTILQEFVAGNSALDRIQEWQPPALLSLPLWPVLAALVLYVVTVSRRGLSWREGVVVLAWFGFGLTANRSIPVMWIALLPTIAGTAMVLDDLVPTRASLPRPAMVAAGSLLLALPLLLPRTLGVDTTRFPVEAAEHLSSDRVFHSDATGGYLIYAQWPEREVYIDDRAELYHDQYVQFTEVAAGKVGWEEELDRWDIDEALLEVDRPLAEVLRLAGWTEVFRDEHFVVLLRS